MKLFLMSIIVIFSSCSNRLIQNELVGEWDLCQEEHNGMVTMFNVCPIIEFYQNGKGKITKPSNDEITFTYVLSFEDQMEFLFETDQQYFNENKYYYKIYTTDNLITLELSCKSGSSKYRLVKSIETD